MKGDGLGFTGNPSHLTSNSAQGGPHEIVLPVRNRLDRSLAPKPPLEGSGLGNTRSSVPRTPDYCAVWFEASHRGPRAEEWQCARALM
jgi:hypothetical protein